jgi:N-methylhydantoinase A
LTALTDVQADTVAKFWAEMADEAGAVLAEQGFAPERQVFSYSVDARYSGQEHTVTVPVPTDLADPAAHIGGEFEQLHRQHYGHTLDDSIEVTTFRLSAVGVVDKPQLPLAPSRQAGAPEPLGSRAMVVSGGDVTADVYVRERLQAGDELAGPAVIVEHTATTVMHLGDHLRVGDHGELVITLGATS